MAQVISNNNKCQIGFSPPFLPRLSDQATDEEKIPLIQQDGSVKYVSEKEFLKMAEHDLLEIPSQTLAE